MVLSESILFHDSGKDVVIWGEADTEKDSRSNIADGEKEFKKQASEVTKTQATKSCVAQEKHSDTK